MATYCPVCDKPLCGHLDPDTLARLTREQVLEQLKPYSKTPLDLGVARFAADVAALLAR